MIVQEVKVHNPTQKTAQISLEKLGIAQWDGATSQVKVPIPTHIVLSTVFRTVSIKITIHNPLLLYHSKLKITKLSLRFSSLYIYCYPRFYVLRVKAKSELL